MRIFDAAQKLAYERVINEALDVDDTSLANKGITVITEQLTGKDVEIVLYDKAPIRCRVEGFAFYTLHTGMTVTMKINDVAVTGLDRVPANGGKVMVAATGNNTVARRDKVSLEFRHSTPEQEWIMVKFRVVAL